MIDVASSPPPITTTMPFDNDDAQSGSKLRDECCLGVWYVFITLIDSFFNYQQYCFSRPSSITFLRYHHHRMTTTRTAFSPPLATTTMHDNEAAHKVRRD